VRRVEIRPVRGNTGFVATTTIWRGFRRLCVLRESPVDPLLPSLHLGQQQHEKQPALPPLRPADEQRAVFAQDGIRLHQHLVALARTANSSSCPPSAGPLESSFRNRSFDGTTQLSYWRKMSCVCWPMISKRVKETLCPDAPANLSGPQAPPQAGRLRCRWRHTPARPKLSHPWPASQQAAAAAPAKHRRA